MTSTLLRELTTELELLIWTRQLQKVRFDEYASLHFLSNAISALREAKQRKLSPCGRYLMAHDGIYALCLGSIYLHGVLPMGQDGHKALVLQLASEMLELPANDRHLILEATKHVAASSCDYQEPVDDQAVGELVALGNRAIIQARYVYPEWFL